MHTGIYINLQKTNDTQHTPTMFALFLIHDLEVSCICPHTVCDCIDMPCLYQPGARATRPIGDPMVAVLGGRSRPVASMALKETVDEGQSPVGPSGAQWGPVGAQLFSWNRRNSGGHCSNSGPTLICQHFNQPKILWYHDPAEGSPAPATADHWAVSIL